jgi:uroporphyrinogen III methyltransferase/synthase
MSSAETFDVRVRRGPLSDRTIVVTRPEAQAGELADALQALGAEVRRRPTIQIVPPADPGPLEAAVRLEATFDWVVFTSANGVRALVEAADRAGSGIGRVVGSGRVCCVGPTTARAAERAGLVVSLVPNRYEAEAVVEALATTAAMEDAQVLLPVAGGARDLLPNELRRWGAMVRVVPVYETVGVPKADDEVLSELIDGVDMVTFTSPSSVHGFHALFEGGALVPAGVIGPVTATTARDYGHDVTVQAEDFTAEGLVKAIVSHYTDELS